ncbi:MAG TPA: HEAT repeat domain-containing protein [Acidimicrobiales bacterium]|nr:HEAT repeat domain-containing protein [Acidimicrobiales bacterium]
MAPVPEHLPTSADRRRAAAVAGHTGDEKSARAALADPASEVRASALGALARLGALEASDVVFALADPAVEVRRRACDLAGRLHMAALAVQLCEALADGTPAVVEAACYALGELEELSGRPGTQAAVVARLFAVAASHQEPLCREAAVAALGGLGSPGGLGAVLAALEDKPAIRRRAVVALAAFDGEEVERALARAELDSDWQVRQTAEDLLGHRPRP